MPSQKATKSHDFRDEQKATLLRPEFSEVWKVPGLRFPGFEQSRNNRKKNNRKVKNPHHLDPAKTQQVAAGKNQRGHNEPKCCGEKNGKQHPLIGSGLYLKE